jgi:ATP-binding cassette subfamily B protein
MMLIMGPITNIVRIIEVWQRGLASLRRLDDIFSAKSDIVDRNDKADFSINGSIEICNLTFKYPGSAKNVLKDINLTLPKGKTLGILGKSGSGKTTLVNLLLRLYPVDDGHIYIDGEDINNIPLGVLREKIGCVPQDHFLFSTTISDNIGFFNNTYSRDEIEQASKLSAVYDNIAAFPDGFDTVVGERGITLSGGQKQRISIARALIKQPAILIMDDSLSAVDVKTEEQILGNMSKVLEGLTGVIISHRVTALRHADNIVYFDKGRIVESGSHEELMNLKGRYYNLYRLQNEENDERMDVLA